MHTFGHIECDLIAAGITLFAGVDEAGRGPLAGPVVAAAVMFAPGTVIDGVADSKALSAAQREAAASIIREHAISFGMGMASPEEIDDINILQASMLAMRRAVAAMDTPPGFLLVDGNRFAHETLPFRTVVKGDALCFSIAAASILAKVERDAIMRELDAHYPQYGFARHKGYPTAAHVAALRDHGPSPVHRRSFTVKSLSEQIGIFSNERPTGTRSRGRGTRGPVSR
ncbi:MAG: ribonuclease HII [Bacteroidetes bacterium]|nr:ribonuclease HII [Bacteroidota bacterium]